MCFRLECMQRSNVDWEAFLTSDNFLSFWLALYLGTNILAIFQVLHFVIQNYHSLSHANKKGSL